MSRIALKNLILATGARERFLPFPGWTLPNVMGAGGLQAMVKSGLRFAGKRVVVAGTGPLLLAVAAYLREQRRGDSAYLRAGAVEQLARFGAALIGPSGKDAQGVQLKTRTGGHSLRRELLAAGGAGR